MATCSSECICKAGSELFTGTAVDDEVNRTVDDGTESGNHVKIDMPGENVVGLLLFIAGDYFGYPKKNKDYQH